MIKHCNSLKATKPYQNLLLCSHSPYDVPPEPRLNVSIAAVRGAVRLFKPYQNVCIQILVTTFPEWLRSPQYGTIAAHTRRVYPRCVCSVLRAHVQFCRFDKAGATASVQTLSKCVCIPIFVTTFPEWLSGTEPLPRTPSAVRPSSLCL